jgi:hypothetical protein
MAEFVSKDGYAKLIDQGDTNLAERSIALIRKVIDNGVQDHTSTAVFGKAEDAGRDCGEGQTCESPFIS